MNPYIKRPLYKDTFKEFKNISIYKDISTFKLTSKQLEDFQRIYNKQFKVLLETPELEIEAYKMLSFVNLFGPNCVK